MNEIGYGRRTGRNIPDFICVFFICEIAVHMLVVMSCNIFGSINIINISLIAVYFTFILNVYKK